ncbi:MAG: L,D-transpeptidase family protein, partial [Bacteroidota bacterium]
DTQLIVVTTPAWDQFRGKLHRFEGGSSNWKTAAEPIDIVVGKNGLGWSVHEKEKQSMGGPIKKEGDLKSPAGIFNLGTAFGYAETATWLQYPYWPITTATMCIEDVQSEYYNQIIDEGEVPADWSSTDHMLRKDDLYEWGIFVEHNYPEAQPKGGSCIFIHVWNPKRTGTAGCTAMDKGEVQRLMAWLDQDKAQRMIQMPQPIYDELQTAEQWPALN